MGCFRVICRFCLSGVLRWVKLSLAHFWSRLLLFRARLCVGSDSIGSFSQSLTPLIVSSRRALRQNRFLRKCTSLSFSFVLTESTMSFQVSFSVLVAKGCPVMSCRVVSCNVVSLSFRVVSHSCRVAVVRVMSHSCRAVSCRVVPHSCRAPLVSCRVVSHSCRVLSCVPLVSYHFVFVFVSLRVVSHSCRFRVVSCVPLVSCHFVSYRFVSFRTPLVSCRVVSHSCRVVFVPCRVVSYRVVSYRFVSCLVVSGQVALSIKSWCFL